MKGPFQVYIGLIPTGYLHTKAIDKIIQDGALFCNIQKSLENFGTPSVLLKPDLSNGSPSGEGIIDPAAG